MTVFDPELAAVLFPAALRKKRTAGNRSFSLGSLSIIRRVKTAGLAGLAGLSNFHPKREGWK